MRIQQRLRASGEREIASRQLGEWVVNELRQLDQVAFVRFATSTEALMSARNSSRQSSRPLVRFGSRQYMVCATKTPIAMPSRSISPAILSCSASGRSRISLSSRAVKPCSAIKRSWAMGSSPALSPNIPKCGA